MVPLTSFGTPVDVTRRRSASPREPGRLHGRGRGDPSMVRPRRGAIVFGIGCLPDLGERSGRMSGAGVAWIPLDSPYVFFRGRKCGENCRTRLGEAIGIKSWSWL